MNQPKNNNLKDEIRQFVIKWNNDFPIDRWWRNKHHIAFGSKSHKEVDFIQMFLEYEEDLMVKKLSKKSDTEETSDFSLEGERKMTSQQIDDEFDNFDPSSLNK